MLLMVPFCGIFLWMLKLCRDVRNVLCKRMSAPISYFFL